jgi:hypothetical protein
LWEGGSSEPLFFLCKEYGTAQMALKRLPVLFFVAESTAKGRLQPRKGLREGSGTEKRTQKSVTL